MTPILLILTHAACVAFGCAVWRYLVERPEKRYVAAMQKVMARNRALQLKLDINEMENNDLWELHENLLEQVKEHKAFTVQRRMVAEASTPPTIDMADEQEQRRAKAWRRG